MTIGENLDVNSKVAVKKIKEKLPRVKTEKTTPKNPATKSEASFSFVAEEKGRIKAKKELKKDDKFTVIKTIRTGKEIKKNSRIL